MICPTPQEMAEERINRILTQYRESPKLLHMLRTYLGAVAQTALQVCELPEKFDLETAVGDQLTLIGKRLGWPRTHCVCDQQPVFGFECPGVNLRPITGFGRVLEQRFFGFCEGTAGFAEPYDVTWEGCPAPLRDYSSCSPNSTWAECASGLSEVDLDDDDLYRRFLKVRIRQMLQMYSLDDLNAALQDFFGPTAQVLHAGQGRVVVAPGRDLSDAEINLLQLYPRVLPIALGVDVLFHFGAVRVFGFGAGWGGLCEQHLVVDNKTGLTFGFRCGNDYDDQLGGFCEPWLDDANIGIGSSDILVDEDDNEIVTGPVAADTHWACVEGAPWMCEIDVRPYSC